MSCTRRRTGHGHSGGGRQRKSTGEKRTQTKKARVREGGITRGGSGNGRYLYCAGRGRFGSPRGQVRATALVPGEGWWRARRELARWIPLVPVPARLGTCGCKTMACEAIELTTVTWRHQNARARLPGHFCSYGRGGARTSRTRIAGLAAGKVNVCVCRCSRQGSTSRRARGSVTSGGMTYGSSWRRAGDTRGEVALGRGPRAAPPPVASFFDDFGQPRRGKEVAFV
jgi:hypothetical protein